MQIVLLADAVNASKIIGKWYFDEWASKRPGATLDKVVENTATYISRVGPPLIVVAKSGEEIIGAAQLKIREMDIYPDYEYWLGGVYVEKSARSKGVGSSLVREILGRAEEAGIDKLYLQTEQLDGGMYTEHGFKPLNEADYKGHHVLVMEAKVNV